MPLHVVLFQPEIPPNTGNVIRLCANTGRAPAPGRAARASGSTRRSVRRSGLDYHELADVQCHADPCGLPRAACAASPRWFAFSTRGSGPLRRSVHVVADDVLVFGPETRGLPEEVLAECRPERRLRIPMRPRTRSLNLSNAVAVVVYEAWRQLRFDAPAG